MIFIQRVVLEVRSKIEIEATEGKKRQAFKVIAVAPHHTPVTGTH